MYATAQEHDLPATKQPQKAKRQFRRLRKLFRVLVFFTVASLVCYALMLANHFFLTRHTITEERTISGTQFVHEDHRTTGIVNYLTGSGNLPYSERLPLFRLYVKSVREDAHMTVPENLHELGWSELIILAEEWYLETTPSKPKNGVVPKGVINDLFVEAVQPPLKRFGPNANHNLWKLMIDIGSPKVRWVEERNEFASWLVAHSAGDKQSFYNPFNNTIYISYSDAVRRLNDETGHAEQFTEDPYGSYPRMFYSLLSSWVLAVINLPTEAQRVYRTRYEHEETFEGEAHGPIKTDLLTRHGLLIVDEKALEKPDPKHTCTVPSSRP